MNANDNDLSAGCLADSRHPLRQVRRCEMQLDKKEPKRNEAASFCVVDLQLLHANTIVPAKASFGTITFVCRRFLAERSLRSSKFTSTDSSTNSSRHSSIYGGVKTFTCSLNL